MKGNKMMSNLTDLQAKTNLEDENIELNNKIIVFFEYDRTDFSS